jgi:hypothetical protein
MQLAQPVVTQPTTGARSWAPVFVLGCVRSGTTLLYHMLLSAGDFAIYRTESNVLNLLEPRFGDLSIRQNKERLMDAWLDSKLFRVSGLDAQQIRQKVLAECTNGGHFLRIVMGEIAKKQGVRRWADCTPEHLLHVPRIKETIPDALVIHIIRDGRDVALSADKLAFVRRAPWDRKPSVMAAGLYWEWVVTRGRRDGRALGHDYMEVRFEDLVTDPRGALAKLSGFIGHDLDYDRIREVGIGSVREPNSSFKEENSSLSPVRRWQRSFPPDQLAVFEGLVGETLQELGYPPKTGTPGGRISRDLKRMRSLYRAYFDSKLYFKAKTPLGKLLVTRDLSWL